MFSIILSAIIAILCVANIWSLYKRDRPLWPLWVSVVIVALAVANLLAGCDARPFPHPDCAGIPSGHIYRQEGVVRQVDWTHEDGTAWVKTQGFDSGVWVPCRNIPRPVGVE
jgi:hypothetical protein